MTPATFRGPPALRKGKIESQSKRREHQMRSSLLIALLIGAFALPATAAEPVKGVVKGTGTAAKGVVKGTGQAGAGVVRGTGTAVKQTGHGLRCIFTLGTSC
jgi:hypothetical protein